MVITNARLIKYDPTTNENGVRFDIEYELEWTGLYDPIAMATLASVTDSQTGLAVDVSIGAEVGVLPGGGSVFITERKPSLRQVANGSLPGRCILTLTASEAEADQFLANPIDRPDVLTMTRLDEQREVYKDKDDKAILTTAREVYASLPMLPVAKYAATITGYRSDFSYLQFQATDFNIVNSDAFTLKTISVGAGEARLAGATARSEVINGYPVVAYTWQLEFKKSWKLKLLNAGNYELVTEGAKKVQYRIKDGRGLDRQIAWPLTAEGVALPDDYADTAVVFNEYNTTTEIAFSSFGWHF